MSQVAPNSNRVQEFLEDPKINDSWYLEAYTRSALSIDIEGVWEEYTGQDVTVGVIDSQIDFHHKDLSRAYDETQDYDFDRDTGDISINSKYITDHHGTMVAGMIAAEGGNDVGSVGISPDATLVGLAINYSSPDISNQVVQALNAAVDLDVVNNSWSFSANFRDNFRLSSYADHSAALENLATNGRDGLGTSVVFSAGNGGIEGASNYHNFQNSPYSIAVGAVERFGDVWENSNTGANVLLSAAGHQAVTTYSNDRYALPSGTSFAAPQVAGAIALMLEANPDLGYRDIQQILALSSTREGLSDTPLVGDGWLTNGAENFNGGGMHYSDAFGYGFLNVHNAVRLAETWDKQQTAANLDTVVVEEDFDLALEAGTKDHIQATFEMDETVMVEHVRLALDLNWQNNGDLDVYLTSPDGTTVHLVYDAEGTSYIGGLRNFTLTSVATMGELSSGEWTIDIYNRDPDAASSDGSAMTGVLNSATLTLHGEADGLEDDTYFYTDEFGSLYADETARHMLQDSDGGVDTLNAAAVTSDSVIDLSGGKNTTIAGVTVEMDTPSNIENAYAGDGNDTVIGSEADNHLRAGRGDDTLQFSAGEDVLAGGAGIDTLRFEFNFSEVYGYLTEAQTLLLGVVDYGLATVSGVESFEFYDVTYSLAELTSRLGNGADTPNETPDTSEEVDTPDPIEPAPVEDEPEEQPVDDTPADPVEPPVTFDEVQIGTAAADALRGSSLRDHLTSAGGDDTVFGFAGDDLLEGGDGNDRIKGGDDNDSLRGDSGTDALFGGMGDDLLEGGADNDKLIGHEGNDTLIGGSGRDVLRGGDGADTYVFDLTEADQLDVLFGFSATEGDTIVVQGLEEDAAVSFDLLFKDNGSVFLQAEIDGETTRLAKLVNFEEDALTVDMQADGSAFLY